MNARQNDNWIKHMDFMVINLCALILSFLLAYGIRFGDFGFAEYRIWRTALLIMCLFNLIITFMTSPYKGILRRPYYEDIIRILLLSVYSFVLVSIFFYVVKIGGEYSRVTIVLTHILFFFLACMCTHVRKKMILNGKSKTSRERMRRLFLIAEKGSVEEVRENVMAGDIQEYEIAGYAFIGGREPGEYDGMPVIPIADAADYITTHQIDDLFVAANPGALDPESYRKIVGNNVTVHLDIESMMGIEGEEHFVSRVGAYTAAGVGPYSFDPRRAAYLALKRLGDIVVALISCVLLLPLAAIVKIAYVAAGDRAPVFYRQRRVGLHGKEFKLYKFRSMVSNADELLQELLQDEGYRREWEENQKFDDDPRITKIGRFLRRTSLDEFPQFINVLKGEMSLIGPRPLVAGELEAHGGLTLYNRVKPGITGWWGCNGRSNINYRERLELEYYYVRNCSLYLDLLIVARTAVAVLKRQGAQ